MPRTYKIGQIRLKSGIQTDYRLVFQKSSLSPQLLTRAVHQAIATKLNSNMSMTTREKILAGALIFSLCINWGTIQSLWSAQPRVGPKNGHIRYISDDQHVIVQVVTKGTDDIYFNGAYTPDAARDAARRLEQEADKVEKAQRSPKELSPHEWETFPRTSQAAEHRP